MNPDLTSSTSWSIQHEGVCKEAEELLRQGTKFQLANGYMGCRGTLDEFRAEHYVAIPLAGIYDQVGQAWREPVNAPNPTFTQIKLNGVDLHTINTAKLLKHHHLQLVLHDAVLERTSTFVVEDVELTLHSRKFLSLSQPNLICVEFSVQTSDECELAITTGIDTKVWDLNGRHLHSFETETDPISNTINLSCKTHEQRKSLFISETIRTANSLENMSLFTDEDGVCGRRFHLTLKPGHRFTFHKFTAITKTGDAPENQLKDRAETICSLAKADGFPSCLEQHHSIWDQRWQTANICIEGDPEADLALRYSIFQLLMVAPVAGSGNSIPARALSGQVYKGAIFWDTEFFMFPFYLHTFPEVAEDLLRYRINTLPGARRKAQHEGTGFRGAFYAWESQETGDDACTYFNVGDPFTGRELRTHFRDKQIHISGDIALAFWDHFRHTGNDQLLREGGAEVILECARFYTSWVYFKTDKHRYEVLDVIGPDEYHERVNNNAFTNRIVLATFETALAVIDHFQTADSDFLEALLDKLQIRDELSLFEDIRKKLFQPASDQKTGLIEQFDSYFKLEDASLEKVKSRKKLPNEYLGAGQGVAAHTQIIKQADVIMMLHRFRGEYSSELKAKNWEYYEPRTEHGSSLSACAYAMVAADCGWVDRAYPYFLKTAKVDLEANYKMYAGTTFIGGSHPAASGGSWMSVVFGFAGLDASGDTIKLRPKLPKHWTQISFRFQHQKGEFQININHDSVAVTPLSNSPSATAFEVTGIHKVVCDQPTNFPFR